MFRKVDVIYEPLCEILREEHAYSIPVCRDKLREKEAKLQQYRKENYEFERVATSCERCRR